MEKTLNLIREHIKIELDSNRIARDVLSSILDYNIIVLESGIVDRYKRKYGITLIKKVLRKLTDEGLLDTGSEANTRWYCLRRECKNHYTAKIEQDKEFREQLKRFIGIYDE